MMEYVEKIVIDGKVLAIVMRKNFNKLGCNFVTPIDLTFQLGVHIEKSGTHIKAHKHIPFKELKEVYPQEFFYVEYGKIEVGIHNENNIHKKVILSEGDMILLNCPHEVKLLEDSKFLELKQGPYRGKDAEKEYLI